MYLFNLNWIDASFAAAMIMTDIDIEVTVTTNAQKIFLIFYAFIVIFILLSMVTIGVQYFFNLY